MHYKVRRGRRFFSDPFSTISSVIGMTTTKYANTYTKIRHAGIMTDYSLMNKGMALPECLCETKAKPAIKESIVNI